MCTIQRFELTTVRPGEPSHARWMCPTFTDLWPKSQRPPSLSKSAPWERLILAAHSKAISEYEADKGSGLVPLQSRQLIRGEVRAFICSRRAARRRACLFPRRSRFRACWPPQLSGDGDPGRQGESRRKRCVEQKGRERATLGAVRARASLPSCSALPGPEASPSHEGGWFSGVFNVASQK